MRVDTPTDAQATTPMNRSLRRRRPANQLMAAPASGAKLIRMRRLLARTIVGAGLVPARSFFYNFKTLESSTSNDSRLRKMLMMIPKPTAASAAATVITMKTNNCPETSREKLEKATKVRFTALSISSMHMNIEITLRLIITPTTPIVNSTADSARYHESCGDIVSSQLLVVSSSRPQNP